MRAFLRRNGAITAIYWGLIAFTRYDFFGDTVDYAHTVVASIRGTPSATDPLWEFGHLLWRPLLLFLYRALAVLMHPADGPFLTVIGIAIALNLLGGYVGVLAAAALARRLVGTAGLPLLVSTAFACFYSFLNYAHTGAPYVAGLGCLMVAAWLAVRCQERGLEPVGLQLAAAIALAAAVLLWLPYVLAAPAVALIPVVWKTSVQGWRNRSRWWAAASILTAAGILTLAVYGVGISQAHIHDVADLKSWISSSSHGWQQTKRLLRAGMGVPRSFLYAGNDGALLKQYVLHDPYGQVSLSTLIRVVGWKLAAFYLFAAALIWVLIRTAERWVLVLLTVAGVPLFGFAVFVFESGSPERYLPLFPFVCIALALVLSERRSHPVPAAIVIGFLVLAIVLNTGALSLPVTQARIRQSLERLEPLRGRTGTNGLIVVATRQDGVYDFISNYPFHAINKERAVRVSEAAEVANARSRFWREDLSARILENWRTGGRVWIATRLLAERPERTWNWTEGDDANVHWSDFPVFFRNLSYAPEAQVGTDGFVELLNSSGNVAVLGSYAGRK